MGVGEKPLAPSLPDSLSCNTLHHSSNPQVPTPNPNYLRMHDLGDTLPPACLLLPPAS